MSSHYVIVEQWRVRILGFLELTIALRKLSQAEKLLVVGQVFFCNSSCGPSGRECNEGGLCKQMTGHVGREALCLGR